MRTMTLEEKRESLNNVLDSINELDDIVLESDADVLLSMGMTYNKASVILENYDYYDYNEIFAIFQEEDTTATQSSEPTANSDMNAKAAETNQNAKKGFFAFFINIFKKIVQFFKDAWNGRIAPAFENAVNKIKGTEPVKEDKMPIWKAILTKPLDWIKNHAAATFGIGAAGVAVLVGIKMAITKLEDNNPFKKFLTKFFNAIEKPFKVEALIFKYTIWNNRPGIGSNFSLQKLKELFTTHIPNFFKMQLKLIKVMKAMTNNASQANNQAELDKAVEECQTAFKNIGSVVLIDENIKKEDIEKLEADAGKGTENQNNEAIVSLERLLDLKKSFDDASKQIQDVRTEVDKIAGTEDKATSWVDGFFAKQKEMNNRFNKTEESVGTIFKKTSVIGGLIGGIISLFSDTKTDFESVEAQSKALNNSTEVTPNNNGQEDNTTSQTDYEKVEFAADDNDATNGYNTLNKPENRKTLYKKGEDGKYTLYGETEELDRNNTYRVKEKADDGSEVFKENDKFEKVIKDNCSWEEILKRDELKNEDMITLFPEDTLKTAGIEGDEISDFFNYVLTKYKKDKKAAPAPESEEEKGTAEPVTEETDVIKKGNDVSGATLLKFLQDNEEYKKFTISRDGHILDKHKSTINTVPFKTKIIDGKSINKGIWNSDARKYHLEYDANNIDDNDDIISESWYNKF